MSFPETSKEMAELSLAEQATALCRSCGMCCDGTLFKYLPLADANEAASFPKEANVNEQILQPCPNHSDTKGCQIYCDRPSSCVAFRCAVLHRLRNEEIGFEDASRLVDLAKKNRDQVLSAIEARASFLTPMRLCKKYRLVFQEPTSGGAARWREDVDVHLAYASLGHLLRKHFLAVEDREE